MVLFHSVCQVDSDTFVLYVFLFVKWEIATSNTKCTHTMSLCESISSDDFLIWYEMFFVCINICRDLKKKKTHSIKPSILMWRSEWEAIKDKESVTETDWMSDEDRMLVQYTWTAINITKTRLLLWFVYCVFA